MCFASLRRRGGALALADAMMAGYLAELPGQALQLEALARRFYGFFNERRFDKAERMVDLEALFSFPAAPDHLIGRAGYGEIARRWTEGFPHARLSIRAVHVSGDAVVTDLRLEGTHRGALDLPGLEPIPPSGRYAHLQIRETITVHHGLIVDVRVEFDPAGLCRILGH
jgi:predicted ester cyclase